ncbi:ABC transporter ATP-binding protein [Clostridium taeniosporum]|uniref:ABC transporter ATP-binding protein n=1 Tax=Clostridium taeniosporum TaxID=394958 RepID=A0A1D7XM85_9CLOT|nr:ABC transporter ATP-binding protein [Clostridium taeniosporum]AOR24434.1 ABC transporter ATP-binding protein [Clostridium taeniosporum]
MSFIKLNNVYKEYGKDDTLVLVLKNINLQIEEGSLIAIIGSSGSGKSTLLNILGGIDKVTSGEVIIDNEKIDNIDEKKRAKLRNKNIGFVFQNFALLSEYTVIENVELAAIYSNLLGNTKHNKKVIKEKALNLLKDLDIENLKNKKITELSGGQQQRVSIARSLINDPKIILADEPTGALDTKNGKEVMKIFKKLNSLGKTVIIVTHDERIANLCDKIIKIDDGEIVI